MTSRQVPGRGRGTEPRHVHQARPGEAADISVNHGTGKRLRGSQAYWLQRIIHTQVLECRLQLSAWSAFNEDSMKTSRCQRPRGFTLVELLIATAVVAILAALALPAYRMYVERAELSQLLIHVDEIATAVRVEDALGERALQQGATSGKSPPRLPGLTDGSFNEPGGIRLLLIWAPAGVFESDRAQYGLIADASGAQSPTRIHELAHLLPFGERDKVWLTPTQLAFPLMYFGSGSSGSGSASVPGNNPGGSGTGPGGTTQLPSQPGTGWTGTAQMTGPTWTCSAQAAVMGLDGQPLGGSVGARIRVTTRFTAWDGTPGQRGWDDVVNLQGGQGRISLSNLNAQPGQGEVITGCRFEVIGMDYYWPTQPAVRWDGTAAAIEISKP